ncbi:unnamed protein product [Gongylonema pulchrum]|uniref:Ras-associating domain-containing protein n=1 Tax=Gongylonema pulchrum TaxID=637853 RepID=A0A183EMM4_9BILA|nr:unnamed protein product [Gongylonema pulchrum]
MPDYLCSCREAFQTEKQPQVIIQVFFSALEDTDEHAEQLDCHSSKMGHIGERYVHLLRISSEGVPPPPRYASVCTSEINTEDRNLKTGRILCLSAVHSYTAWLMDVA